MRRYSFTLLITAAVILSACGGEIFDKRPEPVQQTVGSTPAVRLNFRYEPDVPAPTLDTALTAKQEINAAIQSDFDNNRIFELLERTIASPDKKQIVAVYRHIADASAEYRLDMYSPDGMLQRKMTSDAMAVHFPDTIVWSPNSASLAFVAMTRAGSPLPVFPIAPIATPTPADSDVIDATEGEATPTATPTPGPTPAAPTGILTFNSEQIYIANADGTGARAVTQNEGIIYFYYAWSPDSTMLVSLAATANEWRVREVMAESKGEMMVPLGRPRIVEKNGRERRLDDNQTPVKPVWSPDSQKVAAAFENQIRIYDATGTNPTQAAIPLRNQLLISAQSYDRQLQRATTQTADGASPAPTEPEAPISTLPDPKLLVSYNPIVQIAWTQENLIAFQTAYMAHPVDTAPTISNARWHRLALSVQPTSTPSR